MNTLSKRAGRGGQTSATPTVTSRLPRRIVLLLLHRFSNGRLRVSLRVFLRHELPGASISTDLHYWFLCSHLNHLQSLFDVRPGRYGDSSTYSEMTRQSGDRSLVQGQKPLQCARE